LADALRAGYFHNPGTGRDQNAAFGEMHTFPELRAGRGCVTESGRRFSSRGDCAR
jgi:hypothetical protein